MPSVPPPVSLDCAAYFHQTAPIKKGYIIPPYVEWVEVVTTGKAWVLDGGIRREVGPGDLLWQAPGDMTLCGDDREAPFRALTVHFTVRRAKGSGVRRFSKWPDLGEIQAFIRETCRLQWDHTFDRALLRDYLFSKLLFQVRLYERSLQWEGFPEPVTRALQRIENDYCRPLPLKTLAAGSGWSAAHLHAEFLKHVQTTPHQRLIQKRVQAAKERLSNTAEPLKQIAAECGFADLAAFAHAFKTRTGQTPTAFRRAHIR